MTDAPRPRMAAAINFNAEFFAPDTLMVPVRFSDSRATITSSDMMHVSFASITGAHTQRNHESHQTMRPGFLPLCFPSVIIQGAPHNDASAVEPTWTIEKAPSEEDAFRMRFPDFFAGGT